MNDTAFAAARARRLGRAGRSRQAVSAHLQAKGVAPELARTVLPDEAGELLAAVIQTRRRRIGAFRTKDTAGPDDHRRELAMLARAGFGGSVARAALALGRDDAQGLIDQARREGE